MSAARHRYFLLVFVSLAALPPIAAAPSADLLAPEKRRPAVELMQQLAKPATLPPLPADLVQPFNPAAFGQPDPDELRAIAAAQAAAAAASASSKPSTDRDFLQIIAARVMPSGTLDVRGTRYLTFGQKRLRIGDQLTVTYDGQDYNIELTGIDATTFTLRLNRDEVTRPIKPGKSP